MIELSLEAKEKRRTTSLVIRQADEQEQHLLHSATGAVDSLRAQKRYDAATRL